MYSPDLCFNEIAPDEKSYELSTIQTSNVQLLYKTCLAKMIFMAIEKVCIDLLKRIMKQINISRMNAMHLFLLSIILYYCSAIILLFCGI